MKNISLLVILTLLTAFYQAHSAEKFEGVVTPFRDEVQSSIERTHRLIEIKKRETKLFLESIMEYFSDEVLESTIKSYHKIILEHVTEPLEFWTDTDVDTPAFARKEVLIAAKKLKKLSYDFPRIKDTEEYKERFEEIVEELSALKKTFRGL